MILEEGFTDIQNRMSFLMHYGNTTTAIKHKVHAKYIVAIANRRLVLRDWHRVTALQKTIVIRNVIAVHRYVLVQQQEQTILSSHFLLTSHNVKREFG